MWTTVSGEKIRLEVRINLITQRKHVVDKEYRIEYEI
jgi:hypothetical protein